MTTATDAAGTRRRWPVIDAEAPPERLAAFRILAGVFSVGYLLIRFPVFLGRRGRSADAFEGVGVLSFLDEPLARNTLAALVVVAVVAGVATTVGAWFRVSAPLFALTVLVLTTSRSSWGQLLHFENLMVLHLVVVACSPAADAWSVDSRRSSRADGTSSTVPTGASVRYGWPLGIAGLVTVTTYVIAGIAKLRYGGFDWITGDTLQNHIAYAAARLDLIGGNPAPLARLAVEYSWVLPVLAALSVVIELGAPVAFVGGRVRDVWVVSAWLMHAAIFATMYIGFPSPLFGVAFAPFYALEQLVGLVPRRRGIVTS